MNAWPEYDQQTVADLGEKRIIEKILRPLFNPNNEKNSVGDDCAALEIPTGSYALFSTDRVPADLISFRTGVINPTELGRYLGVLNISDIAACGGTPTGLLFNCGLPSDLPIRTLVEISVGLHSIARSCGASVVGGDITSSSELSLSASVVGYVKREHMLRRSGASIGDSVFVSRSVGLTPVALHYCLNKSIYGWLSDAQRDELEGQFKRITPELALGQRLAQSGLCSAAMDNTDGVGQSLAEIARESNCAIRLHRRAVHLSAIVKEAAQRIAVNPLQFALGSGADFCMVGALQGKWSTEKARRTFDANLEIIGEVTAGSGVLLEDEGVVVPLEVRGWNYFRA